METKFYRAPKERNYTMIDNTVLKDNRLTWKAKGLMAYLLSLPDDWEVHFSEIEKHSTDGKSALRSAINELKQYGYLRYEQRRENNKFSVGVYIIIESPFTDFQQTGNLQAEKLKTENQPLLITNTNKELNVQKTDNTKFYTANAEKKKIKKQKEPKHIHGEYKNVLLTDKELEKLCNELGADKARAVIENYSELKEMKGYKYKSDYLALKKWGIDAFSQKQNKGDNYQRNNNNSRYDESLNNNNFLAQVGYDGKSN